MIVVDPKDRITVDEVLAHPWCSTIKVGGPINGLVHEVPRLHFSLIGYWIKSIVNKSGLRGLTFTFPFIEVNNVIFIVYLTRAIYHIHRI